MVNLKKKIMKSHNDNQTELMFIFILQHLFSFECLKAKNKMVYCHLQYFENHSI